MADHSFDVVVLGGGVASQSIVYRLRDAGKSVAVVDAGPLGGTCANAGCDAKKPYVNAAQRVLQSRAMLGHGLTGGVQLDWKALVEFKRSFTHPVPGITRQEMRNAGIEVFEGEPRFDDLHTIAVNDQTIRGEQIVIATGGQPRPLDLPGGGVEHTIDSNDFLELDELPPRVAFVGGGYISMEFAGVAAVAGSKVTVLQSGAYPLNRFDRDAVRVLLSSYADLGIDVLTRRHAVCVKKRPAGGYRVLFAGDAPPIEADLVVAAAGRVPSVEHLGLESVGIAYGSAGIRVDDQLRSLSHDHIWAAGDVADNGRAPLTPTASEDGRVVAHNLTNDKPRSQITTPVVSVAFTLPPIAGVGLTESDAAEHCGPVEVIQGDMSRWKHFRQQGEKHAYFKLIFCDQQTLRGAHLVGHESQEVINVLGLALGERCDRQTLSEMTFGYPTVAFNLISKIKKQTATGDC